MKLLFSGKGLLGLFWSMSAPSGKQNVEKQGIMLYYVDLYVTMCKDLVKEMKHVGFQEEKGCLQSNGRNRS